VSSTKFAAITANLLARKGEAVPSVVVPAIAPARPALVRRGDQRFVSEPPQPDKTEKLRRIVISITQEELERLCIAAIKTGSNRHDIVRRALDDYFCKLSAEFPQPCACMEADPTAAARHARSEARAAPRSYPACAENLDSAIVAMKTAEDQVAM
jgi:Ribbon-helix-helix protein, copG family